MKNFLRKTLAGILVVATLYGTPAIPALQNQGAFFAPTAEAVINGNIINNSWQRLDIDGVDETLTATGHSLLSNTGDGAVAMWVNFDTLTTVGTNGITSLIGSGGSSDTGSNRALVNIGVRTRVGWGDALLDMVYRATTSGTVLSATATTTSITTGTRFFLVAQSNGSTTELYINGVSQTLLSPAWASGAMAGEWFGDMTYVGNRILNIGATTTATGLADGKFDHIMIFNDNLTSDEITALYNGGKAISPLAVGLGPKLVNMYPLGENGSVSTFPDIFSGESLTGVNLETSDIISTTYY